MNMIPIFVPLVLGRYSIQPVRTLLIKTEEKSSITKLVVATTSTAIVTTATLGTSILLNCPIPELQCIGCRHALYSPVVRVEQLPHRTDITARIVTDLRLGDITVGVFRVGNRVVEVICCDVLGPRIIRLPN